MMGSVSCTCLKRCTVLKKCLCKHIKELCSFSCHPGHSCTNSFSFVTDASKSPIINLQNYCCKAPQDDHTPWMEIEDVILYDAQRHILSSDMEWLDDKIILAAELLSKGSTHISVVYNLLHWQKQCLLSHNHLVPFCKFYVKTIITGFWFLLLDVRQKLYAYMTV